MKIKSYFARTVEASMAAARQELGPDAMLLNSRKTPLESRHLGEYEVALGQCQEALAQMRALGDEFVQAAALDTIGHAYRHLGEYALAVEYYTQAAEQCGAIGDRHTRAQSLVSLGEVLAETGDPAGARTTWQQALELHEVLGYDTADIHTRLAGLTATAG